MKDNSLSKNLIPNRTNFLGFLTLSYAMVMVLANWFDIRLIQIFGLTTDAGTLIFPFTFLLANLITEVYGYKHARRAIWYGFLFNLVFIVYGQIIIHMPSPDYPTNNEMFDSMLAANVRIIIASGISYLIAEPLNSLMMAKLKIKMEGRYLGLRFVLSTFAAAGVDSLIFGVIAFYGAMSNANLFALIITMWLIKCGIEIAGLPLSVHLTKKLKQAENMDIYDKNTNFNVFQFDANYTDKDNLFARV